MTDHDLIAEHDAAAHMDARTSISDDDHGPAEAALGPIDWLTWGYGLLGVGAGVLVLLGFWLATN